MTKANEKPLQRGRRYLGAALLASIIGVPAVLAAGCGGVASQPSTLGGESHFLQFCDDSCEGGLDCIGGVCTKGCLVSDPASCSAFSGAECTAASFEPGAVAVCDVACNGDADCAALSGVHGCQSGFCRAPSTGGGGGGSTANVPGMGGSGGAAPIGTGGTGGTASAGAAGSAGGSPADCSIYRNAGDPPPVLEVVVQNRRSATIFVEDMTEDLCEGFPIRVARDGGDVNITSGGCGTSCELVQDQGATGPGSTTTACPAECGWRRLVPIAAGEEQSFRIDALELAFSEMPSACFEGDFASVTCFRRVGLLPGTYEVSARAFTNYLCGPELIPCECGPDTGGPCTSNVYRDSDSLLTATTSFVRPPFDAMIDTSLTTVFLTYDP